MRRFLLIISLLSGLFCVGLWRLSDGFALSKIENNLSFDPRFQVHCPLEPEITQILAQPFRYKGKGSQCFVFQSENGGYVLKFPRSSRYRYPRWLKKAPLPSFLAEIQAKRIAQKEAKKCAFYTSCKLAYERLKLESGLLYLHLNPTERLLGNITLHNNLNRPQIVDLDRRPFLLQKKGIGVYQHLKSLSEEERSEAVSALKRLLKARMEQGIGDRDPEVHKNAGFLGDQPLFLDVGAFYETEVISVEEEADQALKKIMVWLEKL